MILGVGCQRYFAASRIAAIDSARSKAAEITGLRPGLVGPMGTRQDEVAPAAIDALSSTFGRCRELPGVRRVGVRVPTSAGETVALQLLHADARVRDWTIRVPHAICSSVRFKLDRRSMSAARRRKARFGHRLAARGDGPLFSDRKVPQENMISSAPSVSWGHHDVVVACVSV